MGQYAPAAAQTEGTRIIQGHVLAVQQGDIVIDVSGDRGAEVGDTVELWRPLSLRHPVSRKMVRDRFRIGELRLRKVRKTMAIAFAEGDLEREALAGDIVILRRRVAPPPAPPEERPSSGQPAPSVVVIDPVGGSEAAEELPRGQRDSAALYVAKMFEALRGQHIIKRIRVYEQYVRRHPRSRFAKVLHEEAALLRRLVELETDVPERHAVEVQRFDPPAEGLAGRPLSIALRVKGAPRGMMLHARRAGEVHYASTPMKPSGPGYYSVTVPAARMEAPEVQYFIEATTAGGPQSVVGSAIDPEQIDVRDVPKPEPNAPPQATIAAWSDYADYNRFRGDDVAWQTEGYFQMRFGDAGVRALRSGFGVYRGVGGGLEDLDEAGKSPRKVGLTYGYLEGEVGFTDFVGMAGRGVVGVIDGGVTGGAQAFLRIGNDLRTNLLLGGELLGGVGLRGIAQLELNVFEDWPMMVRTEVTNQPAGSGSTTDDVRPDVDGATPDDTSLDTNDIGVRGIAQLGYRIAGAFVISARGSYQGRTIRHSGPGFGGGMSYTW